MAASETPIMLTGRDDAADRAAIARLVHFQQSTPVDGLAPPSLENRAALLEAFRERHLGLATTAKAWRRAADALQADAQAQPRVALLPDGRVAGLLTQDIARLLRATPLDETVELDLAVRWWQAARSAGLPVDPDFGECWRAIEWQAFAQVLVDTGDGPADPVRIAQATRVALRYAPLKPLLPALSPLAGAAPAAGYTF